ncbi:Uncharacterised protein [Orientia tsutsugamushi]|uniref:Uncharacterized protein n=1 Tax=Orientia tsutsugamushi TaxID=784 RepID=A0A2R8F2V4_ORITS|nr:hypothetical protein [Orientia tsutsugamushi]SPM45746.1 Uncharacterised protein [Orientia tsutsugamushi]
MVSYNGQEIERGSEYTFRDDTSLLFLWLSRNYGSSIPEHYLSRLSTWAKTEDQRLIKLVINGSGFTTEQYKELEDKISNKEFNPHSNIELIDFNKLDFNKFNLIQSKSFLEKHRCYKCPISDTISEYYSKLYSLAPEERFPFSIEIDAMRIFTLVALESPLIYFDFDILHKENKKIGEVKAEQGILFAENDGKSYDYKGITDFENAIIAVSEQGRIKLLEIYDEVKNRFIQKHSSIFMKAPHYIYKIISDIICSTALNDNYITELKKVFKDNDAYDRLNLIFRQKTFGFQTNGGNVIITYDHSWMPENSESQSTSIKNELSNSQDDKVDELITNLSIDTDVDHLNTSSNVESIGDVACTTESRM